MTEDTGDTPPPGAAATVRAPVVPRMGGALGRYELGEVLGQGAMATVFRARDTRLGRQVAVKVMNLAMAARSESGERFRREAQAVAAVKHPGIVEIFDFVAAVPPEPAYIVSELIEGPTLRALLDERRGRLLPEAAALVTLPVAEALAVAHARGIVHRDVKPENVMIDRGGKAARVVLTDFGVAHVTGLETMTATGALVGSPAYMSPEQARGHDVGPASDIWALGVMLYQVATGHFPFQGRDPLMVVAAITRGIYKKPSQVSPYPSAAFDEICVRCLKLAPEERYPNAEALAEDLRRYLRAAGVGAGPTALRALLDEGEQFDKNVRAKVADAAVTTARACARKGEFARALAELSRATAYVPRHPEAERLFAAISSRRKWIKVGAAAAVILGLGAGGMKLAPRVSEQLRRMREAPARTEAEQTAAATAQPAVARGETPAETSSPAPIPAAVTAVVPRPPAPESPRIRANQKKPRRVKTAATAPASAPAQPETETPGTATPGTAAPGTETAPAPPPMVTPPPAPRRITVRLLAADFFCTPSLDGGKPRHSAEYTTHEGKHEVWCTTASGEKLLVERMDMYPPPDGSPFRVQLKRGAGNRPIIDPGKTTPPRQPDPDVAGKPAASGSVPR
jgi:tRNA A-37 threonylcarbamoyl transferase component Bud32